MTESSGIALTTHVRKESVAERVDAGKRARKEHPRSTIGNWAPSADRPSPVQMLREQEAVRVQGLVPIRHARMAVSPFTFYRGTAAVMAYDLGTYPHSGLATQLCGDAHLSNFGVFGSPDRSMIFDINDFDETHPGAFDWDVARLVASFYIAATDNQYSSVDRQMATLTAATSYRLAMSQYAAMNDLDMWYSRIDAEFLLNMAQMQAGSKGAKTMNRNLEKARSRDRWSAINKLTVEVDGQRQFVDDPPLLVRLPLDGAMWDVIEGVFEQYRQTLHDDRRELLRRYRIIDFAHKVVGVGSVGLRAFVVLLQGRDSDDLLVLQVKEAVQSVLEPYTAHSHFKDQGHRVVAGQRLMQAASDVFLGWLVGPGGRHFYVRQLRDMKWSPDIATVQPRGLVALAQICGKALARGHARTGDSVKIASYLGTSDVFDKSMLAFSERYAAQVDADFAEFKTAMSDGTLSDSDDEKASIAESLLAEGEVMRKNAHLRQSLTQPPA